jgi:hypothetical protein
MLEEQYNPFIWHKGVVGSEYGEKNGVIVLKITPNAVSDGKTRGDRLAEPMARTGKTA